MVLEPPTCIVENSSVQSSFETQGVSTVIPDNADVEAPLTKYADEYMKTPNNPFLSLAFIIGMLLAAVVGTSVSTYVIQKLVSDGAIDDISLSYASEIHDAQVSSIRGYLNSIEALMEVPILVEVGKYGSTSKVMSLNNNSNLRPMLYGLSRPRIVSVHVYSVECHIVDYEFWNQTGQYRGYSFGFDPSGLEWEGYQPGLTTEYSNNVTSLERTFLRTYNHSSPMEPVMELAQKIEGIGFQRTYIYLDNENVPDVYTGVFYSFFSEGRLSHYINLEFSVRNFDNYLHSLAHKKDIAIALVEFDNGDIIGDSCEQDQPYTIVNGRVTRRPYSQSSEPLLRDAGAYVFEHTPGNSTEIPVRSIREVIGGVDMYLSYGTLHVRNLQWLLYVVVPTSGVRGNVDELNVRITAIISTLYVVVTVTCLIVVIWISRLLRRLCSDMELVADMRLDDVVDNGKRYVVTELRRIQVTFLIMVEMLKEYRNYLPQALLDADDGQASMMSDRSFSVDEGVTGTGEGVETPVTARSDGTIDTWASPRGSETAQQPLAAGGSRKFQTGLHRRKISLLKVTFPDTPKLAQSDPQKTHTTSTDLLPHIVSCIETNEGVCMQLSIDAVVVCWNGHKSTINHERKATACAIEMARILQRHKLKWVVSVASGQGVVGISGTGKHRSPVVLGTVAQTLQLMSHLHVHYPNTVLVTEKTYDAARTMCFARIVDVLYMPDNSKTKVYEVAYNSEPFDITLYLDGVSALQNGKFEEAQEKLLEHMRRPDIPADMHALRLYKMSSTGQLLGERFVGWGNESLIVDPGADLPTDIAAKFVQSSAVKQQIDPQNAVAEDQRLRNEIKLLSPTAAAPTEESNEFQDHEGRVWRKSSKLLGAGAFGEVHLGMGAGGELVALKTIKLKFAVPEEQQQQQRPARRRAPPGGGSPASPTQDPMAALEEVLVEVSLLSELRDENIVGYVSSCVVHGVLVIVMEYIPGGSLASLLKEFNVLGLTATQRYVRDIVRGLAFLHRKDVIHRDVKPHNVLLMIDGQCKLTDFGASAKLGALGAAGEKGKVQGTPLYMAPEQCMGNVCKASDVWGVGILTHQLLTGAIPYPEDILTNFNPFTFMFRLGREDTMVPVLSETLPAVARSFCEATLCRNPDTRATAESLLSHPFLL